jgi:hypothetical protein
MRVFASLACIMTHLNRPYHHAAGDCRWAARSFMYIACDIAGASRKDSDGAPFAQKAMRQLPAQGRSATLWIAAA